jgi:hypothetical protein
MNSSTAICDGVMHYRLQYDALTWDDFAFFFFFFVLGDCNCATVIRAAISDQCYRCFDFKFI